MEPVEPLKEIKKVALDSILGNIGVTRSILHKGKMAPKGHVYFTAKVKRKDMVYSMSRMFNTEGFTEEIETEIKQLLCEQLMNHYNLD